MHAAADWLAAVSLDDLAKANDPSFPTFWLPFQDVTAHNHIAQWVDTIMQPPANCQQVGQDCTPWPVVPAKIVMGRRTPASRSSSNHSPQLMLRSKKWWRRKPM
ncbi:MAG TPA: hypothetical protein VHN14_22375 [Kofleriaceae bacterium]|nr:hypothetical protein [Kofleriaceae bacterium]